jgi:archaeal flagellin FlaB
VSICIHKIFFSLFFFPLLNETFKNATPQKIRIVVVSMNRKAEMGVGTLIIFIALLLVAAVAAGVLIQTAGSLQQKALSTGTQATGQISTNAQVVEVSGTDGTVGLHNLSTVMKLAPGSDPIEFDSVTITLNLKDSSQTLTYWNTSTVYGNTTNFGVEYLQQGTNYQNGVMVRGDVVRLNFNSTRYIASGEDVRINFIPKVGTPTLTVFSVPDVLSTERVYLYP